MRRRPLFWLLVSIACFVGAFYFWRLGDRWAEERRTAPAQHTTNESAPDTKKPEQHPQTVPIRLLSEGGNLNSMASQPQSGSSSNQPSRVAYRLSNTSRTMAELSHSPRAILLENALIDTSKSPEVALPDHLRAKGDPGAYIVQSRSTLDNRFRNVLQQSGATIISYIPNNAYLVRASAAVAQRLEAYAQTVIPYEPYYKLKASLLKDAVEQKALPVDAALNVLVFADAKQVTTKAMQDLGAQLLGEERSPFGVVVKVRPAPESLADLAGLPGVQEIEPLTPRVPANDLSRVALGVSGNSVSTTNYLDLTGTNVLVALADTGVDTNHPALLNTFSDSPISGIDSNGHGTHVAGVMVGTGAQSTTVSNASGSVMPPVDLQFRGKAPGARLFSMLYTAPDTYLQETAATTNALICNNSWHYGTTEYDLNAASYDAAVRDSLPLLPGMQSLVYVFAAGNSGGGDNTGTGGRADSILSPATGKNVITVGAVEQMRTITNEVTKCSTYYGDYACRTNAPWQGMTDDEGQVAGFSSRGNVGVHIEGDTGRFKPDVVAPGTWVVSTRSGQWDEALYYNNTSHVSRVVSHDFLPGETFVDASFFPDNTVQADIYLGPNRNSRLPLPDLPIMVRQPGAPTNAPGGYDVLRTNHVQIPPDMALTPLGVDWWYGVQNITTQSVSLNIYIDLTVTNDLGNYNEVLKGLNDALGPYYRYESGTSMAAGGVAGTLALMEEFFQRQGKTNSPALMKAVLINGSRSVGNLYDLEVKTARNFQGWGMPKLPACIHPALSNTTATASSMFVFDQSPTNALATGSRHTINVKVDPAASSTEPMRVTLVWTDPPGNPVASLKLVNDLDLVVTNLDTGDVYFGNDIGAGTDFTAVWNTNNAPKVDVVNNVENVYITPPLGTNFSITVIGSHVNVNAVTAHTNDVVQDYALVVSCGDGAVSNALTITDSPIVSQTVPYLDIMTNAFVSSPDITGGVLMNQHVGANTPLLGTNTMPLQNYANAVLTLGMTNQWHFYMITNENAYTNAAFMTFIPPNLSVPGMGTRAPDPDNASRPEADIDLYVTTDPTLTNLSPVAINGAYKSISRLGTETIILSNAVPGIYYIGVKSEDQQAAEYALLAAFSLWPFSSQDAQGNQYLRGFPVPQPIPDASVDSANNIQAGTATIFAFAPGPQMVRRVIVTNVLSHELVGDVRSTLTHNADSVTIHNNTTNRDAVINLTYVYDDSDEMNVPGAQRSDGPGTLRNFAGKPGIGAWQLLDSDGAVGHVGTNGPVFIFLEKQQDLTQGIDYWLEPGACRSDYVEIPNDATNLTVDVSLLEGNGPLSVEVCPLGGSGADCKTMIVSNTIGGSVSIDIYDNPPLHPGVYSVRVCNLGNNRAHVYVLAHIYVNPFTIASSVVTAGGAVPIQDDSVTYSYLTNLSHLRISSLDVSMLLNHPRISDLVLTLISPEGKRIVLFEDRGAWTTTGLGTFSGSTNGLSAGMFEYTNMVAFYTNDFEQAAPGLYMPGAQFQGWNVVTNTAAILQDFGRPWLSNNILVLGDGVVSAELPTTNSPSYHLSWTASHAPYLVGTVGWWPLDGDARDIFGGFDGILSGGANTTNGYLMWRAGKVDQAFFGDAVRAGILVPKCPDLDLGLGRGFSIEGWINPTNIAQPGPIAEWNDPTNAVPQGVQFWLSGLSYTNPQPGALAVGIWDTNLQSYFVSTVTNTITNGGWQHVAMTYDAPSLTARIYANGQLAIAQTFTSTNLVPRTFGNFYLGFHPGNNTNVAGLSGGMDEMGLYSRPLSDCEILSIFKADKRGKYGTNVLTCPVAYQVSFNNSSNVYTFTNGLSWTNGPQWEFNALDFDNPILGATNGGPGTNLVQLTFTPLDPNVAIDDVVLWGLVTNVVQGLMHFTDNTNQALVPIKFAPSPYVMSNQPPRLVFSNAFENIGPGLRLTGDRIPGTTNSPDVGIRDWVVTQGPVTVVSNALFNVIGTNSLALARGSVSCPLPVVPGNRYKLTYALRGPAAVGWWNGDLDPLSGRARDLIGDNHGAFYYGAKNTNAPTEVGASALWFPGIGSVTNHEASKIELGDPENLHLTNAITIEGWLQPVPQTNDSFVPEAIEQIFFRGDSRDCRDPYYFGIEQTGPTTFDLIFHVENADKGNCGVLLETADQPLVVNKWQHVAAVFEANVPYTNNNVVSLTNELRMYLDGIQLTNVFLEDPTGFGAYLTSYTGQMPSANLEPSFNPGVAIGNRSRMDNSEPYRGFMDELTVYGRALTGPEIRAIAQAGRLGKADAAMPPSKSLSKAAIWLDNTLMSTGYGDNGEYTESSLEFTAMRTNIALTVQSLLPGTMLDYVILTELPAELTYQPEQPLDQLIGDDAFGIWQLEIRDTRAGATNGEPQLVQWQIDFRLLPATVPPIVYLAHGIPYSGTLAANGTQELVVDVPQWAYYATNVLLSATNRNAGFNLPVGVLFDLTNQPPSSISNALFWPAVASGTNVLTTNVAGATQWLIPGQPYYLTVTNVNPFPVTYTYGVWYDIATLTNCLWQSNYVGPAGIPRYFQFDVPTNTMSTDVVQQVSVWLTGARSNLTMVLSQSLPLPDLAHADYLGTRPSTNDEIVMVVTNSTPFATPTNRWYVGVFNSAATNVPFTITMCQATNYPILVQLTNRVPFIAGGSNQFLSPPGPPRQFFFEFDVTNYVDALLFELYGLSGDADLVLQRDLPPTQPPYYAGSYREGTTPEQIVLRVNREVADLRGKWFLGVYNNTPTNVAYTIRAATPERNGLLNSGMPLQMVASPPAGPHRLVIQWNSVEGEIYMLETASTLSPPDWQLLLGGQFMATTPFSAIELPIGVTGMGFYRVQHVPRGVVLSAPLTVQLWTNNLVRISWSVGFPNYMLQYSDGLTGIWLNSPLPVTTEGNEYVVYDTVGNVPRFYRLMPN